MVLREIRYAFRQLRKSPGFSLTAVLTLAVGIGALTTVATWTNAVLYDPWPRVSDPGTIRFIDATVLGNDGYSVHHDQFAFVRDHARSFTGATAIAVTTLNLALPATEARAMMAGTVSSNYFQFLGVQAQAGRFFDAKADDRAFGAHDEVVLSDGLWREQFAGDPKVVGRTVSLNRHAFTVVGVAPRDFNGIFGGVAEALWVPLSSLGDLAAEPDPDPLKYFGLQMAVRMRKGVGDATAAAELHTLAHSIALTHNEDAKYSKWDLNLRDNAHFERGFFSVIGEQLPVLAGASVLLMILVCINIASLLGQHAARRRREIAIRSALGATPARIAEQVFVQTLLVALGGALAGWGVSVALSRSIYLLLPSLGVPMVFNLRTDARILAFIAMITVAVTLFCGMFPVRQSLRVSQKQALHEGGASIAGVGSRRWGQRILLGAQLAICFIVLVCCGLLTRSAFNVFERGTGFERGGVLTADLDLGRSSYTEERGQIFQRALLDKLRSLPGVSEVTFTSHLPMGDYGSGNTWDLSIPGYVPAKGEEMSVVTDLEGPEFFKTMRIGLREGREFTIHDTAGAPPVAMVNQTMAERYWPKEDAIGKKVVAQNKMCEIVGVVGNYTYASPDDTDPRPLLFLPEAQHYQPYMILALRSRTTPDAVAGALRRAVASLDNTLPVENVQTLEEVSGVRYQFSRIPAELLGVYALSSLIVAVMGLYAVMAYSVIERYREFAVRMALGSTRAGIFRLVLRGSGSIALIGLAAGALGSIAAVRLVRAMLFGVTAFDPLSYAVAAAFLVLTVILSGLAPARRAATIQPMQALRSE